MNKTLKLSIEDTNCLKAVSIVLMVVHNLLHIKSVFHENEFSFNEEIVLKALHFEGGTQLFSMILSYFGWYGVSCFVFLTGYGLTAKYVDTDGIARGFSLISHIKKLLLLQSPIVIYWVILYFFSQRHCGFWQIISTATFTANIFFYERLSIEWYFGLCAQLYVLWYLCFFKRWVHLGIVTSICVVLLICSITFFPDWQIPIRHNFIGWIIPFCLGCSFRNLRVPSIILEHRIVTAFVMLVLFVITAMLRILWLISDIFFIFALVSILPCLRYKPVIFIGTISASMYVMQQIVRRYFLPIPFDYENYAILVSFLYLAINVGAAFMLHSIFRSLSSFKKV